MSRYIQDTGHYANAATADQSAAPAKAVRRALVVVDMINDFMSPGGALSIDATGDKGRVLSARIALLAESFRLAGDTVYFACDRHEGGKDPGWPNHAAPGTWGAELPTELAKFHATWMGMRHPDGRPISGMVPKTQYSAFHNTGLATSIKSFGVDEVYVVGICTDICVFHTVAGAWFNGFRNIFLPVDCCGTFNDAITEQMAVEMMKQQFQIKVV